MATISITKQVDKTDDDRYRLKIYTSETSDNIPSQIFLLELLAPVPEQSFPAAKFLKVCSYADMINYPARAPGTDNSFYRDYYIDLIFTSYNQLNTFLEDIKTDVQTLIDDIALTNTATPVTTTETIP